LKHTDLMAGAAETRTKSA